MKIKYTNEKIVRQIKENSIFLRGIIVMLIISLLLIISGPVITYIQRKIQAPFPDEPKNGLVIYYAELTEMPEELGSGYYSAEINGQKIILSFGNDIYRDIHGQLAEDGKAAIHGTFNYIQAVKMMIQETPQERSLENIIYQGRSRNTATIIFTL